MNSHWQQCKNNVLMIDANTKEEVTFYCTNRDGRGHRGEHYNTCGEYQYLWGDEKIVTLLKDGQIHVYDKEKKWVVGDLFYPAVTQ